MMVAIFVEGLCSCSSPIALVAAFETSPVLAVEVLVNDKTMPGWPSSFA